MIDACTQAMRHGSCALSSASPESTRPESIALVIWQGGELLRVSIRVSRGNGEWASRQIEFSAADALGDRWTAVGLTVATLVDETHPADPRETPTKPETSLANPGPPASPTAESPEHSASTPSPSPSSSRFAFAFAAGGVVGTAWDDGDLQRGFWGSASARWPATPLFAIAGVRYAWSDGPALGAAGTLASRWYDVSLGVGVEAIVRPIRLRIFGAPEIALQFVSATLSESDAQLADRAFRLRARGGIAWPADGRIGAVVGGTMRLLPFSGDDAPSNHARTSRIAADLFGGIELRL